MAEKVQKGTEDDDDDDDDDEMGGGGSHRGRKISTSASLQRENERKTERKRDS